jgi:hypothetical protein
MLNSIWLRCVVAFLFIIINNGELLAQQVFVSSENSSSWDMELTILQETANGRLNFLNYAANGTSLTSIGLARESGHKGFSRVIGGPVLKLGGTGKCYSGGVSVFPVCIIQCKDCSFWMYYSGIKNGESDFFWHGDSVSRNARRQAYSKT